MILIEWNNNLSVKVLEIDAQHKQLVQMINDLHAAMKLGQGRDIVGKIIADMISYADKHFKMEEHYFDKFSYPDAAMHKQEHKLFSQRVKEFKRQYDTNSTSLSVEVIDYLSNWLVNHIKKTDKAYSDFFNSKGLV